MKYFNKIIICLLCILTVSGILFKVFPVKEVKAATHYGYVTWGTQYVSDVRITGFEWNDRTADVWQLFVNGSPAFCAKHGYTVKQDVKYDRFSLSTKIGNSSKEKVIAKVMNWYLGTDKDQNDYSMAQVVIWLIIHNTNYNSLTSSDMISSFDKAMYDVLGSTWHGWKNQAEANPAIQEPASYYLGLMDKASDSTTGIYYYYYNDSTQPVISKTIGTEYPDEPEYPAPIKATINKTASAEEKVTVNLTKTDKDTGKALEGVTFDVVCDGMTKKTGLKTDANGKVSASYTYSYSATSDNFTYCTNYSELSDADKKNCPYSSKAKAEEAALAQANERLNAKLNKSHTCEAVETATRSRYFFDSNNLKATGSVTGAGTVNLTLTNKMQTGTITITKKDAETNKVLKGVVYGLYANEDIVHPDGKTGVVHKKDALVKKFPATGTDGKATLSNLYLGKYYIKEITAPDGYQLDASKHSIDVTSSDSSKSVITKTKEFTDSKAGVTLKKVNADGKVLEGAEFELYANAEIKKVDGTVAFKKGDLVDKFVATDKNGKTSLSGLLAGSYYVVESKAPDGYAKSTKKYEFSISVTGEVKFGDKVITLEEFNKGEAIVIKNKLTKFTISKQDMTTSKELPGATISICQTYLDENGEIQLLVDEETNECVVAELIDGTKLTWISTDKPYVIEGLPAGIYYLVERIAPTDYTKAESILFILKEDGTLTDKDGKDLSDNKLVMYDKPIIVEEEEEQIENVPTGSLSTYIVLGIVGLVSTLGVGSYYYMKKTGNKK